MNAPLQIGMLVFPKVTQLDLTGPLQVFARVPDTTVHLLWKRMEAVPSDAVLTIQPTLAYRDCPQLDVICVPGGAGTADIANDDETLNFLRKQAVGARYVTSVCTGALVLGAAGLLRGYRATTHWASMDFLAQFGAIPMSSRVCIDRNRVTGGGVTAGIDFALRLTELLRDRATAEAIQLALEYNPAPPFAAGSPETAPPAVVVRVRELMARSQQQRGEALARAAARLT